MKVIAIQALPFQRVVRAKNFPCLAPVSQVNMAHLFALTSLLYLERMIHLVMYGRAQFDELRVRSFDSQTIDPNNGYRQFFMEN